MKVKLNQPAQYKGTNYDTGDTVVVNARVGGAWIQTEKADGLHSKKAVRTSKRESTGGAGGKDEDTGGNSGGYD